MDPLRHQQIKQVFLAALDLPREQWQRVLDEQCGNDPALRREVEQLLGFHVGIDGSVPRVNGTDLPDDATRSLGELQTFTDLSEAVDAPVNPTRAPSGPSRSAVVAGRTGDTPMFRLPADPHPSGVTPGDGKRRTRSSSLHIEHGRFLPGAVIAGRYRIVALIGTGGMGEVYRADDLKLGQAVALKFLPPALAQNPKRLEQFLNEVRVARSISHHNVCRVYDIGEHGDEQFISMEYVDGETLDSLVSRIGRIPEPKALQLAHELCAAIAAIHDAGILHRDLKPANIMIDGRGQLRLTDFGLASVRDLHGFEAAAGTPGFVAPEALGGREATQASDIYTLGLLMYELFTGVPAYRPGPAREVIRLQESTDPPAPSTQAHDISPDIERAIVACVARDPADRPGSAREVGGMLPGGNPLAAAIAAGMTPSPELVAASGAHGRISLAAACLWLAVFAGLLVAGRMLWDRFGMLSLAVLPKSPEVLADRAEQIIDRLGYATPSDDIAYDLDLYEEFIGEVEAKDRSPERWARLARTRPSPIDFWYRRSPMTIAPLNPLGWVTWDDPPNSTPGMISLRLSPAGHLRELIVVSEQLYWAVKPEEAMLVTVPMSQTPLEPDWTTLFETAGLDIAKFERAEPVRVPVVFADIRAAWVGKYPEYPDEPVRVEAAGLRGKPVAFRAVEVNWPGSQNIGAVLLGAEQPKTRRWYEVLFGATTSVAIIAGLFLARRNLRLKRADSRGALRVGFVLFLVLLATMLLNADSLTASHRWYSPVTSAFALAVALGVAFGVSYMAIEPYVRRIWPETITAWTRLINGQVLDPLLGQSLLVGANAGALGIVLLGVRAWVMPAVGHPPPEPLFDYDFGVQALGSTRQTLGTGLLIVVMALGFTLVFTLIQVLLRLGLRRTWPAVVAIGLVYGTLWTLKFHATPWSSPESWAVFTICGIGCGVVLVRFGVVALAVGLYVYYLLKIFPSNVGDAWYASISLATLSLVSVIALLGGVIAVWGTSRAQIFGVVGANAGRPDRGTA